MKSVLRIVSVFLTLVLLALSFPALLSFSEEITLSAAFANGLRGDGEGTLTAAGLTAGQSYRWLFINDEGPLPDCEPIAERTAAGAVETLPLPRAFLLPPAATGIALYADGEPAAFYTIPEEKRIPDAEAGFTFASVSDVHMNLDDATYGAKPKWTAALDFFDEKGMDAVVVSGDLTGSGTENEYERYRSAVEASTYDPARIIEAQGNHDSTQVARFLSYTQSPGDVHPFEGSAWFYVLKEGENGARDNLFICMAQELSGTSGTPTTDNFSQRQLDWVEELLESYAGTDTNLFIVEHSMFYNFGPGDKYNGAYVEPMYFYDRFPGNVRLKSLLTTYKEAILMSGHTHLSFREGYNFGDEDETAARMIHNSSISQPRCYTASGSISYNSEGRTNATQGSEGYLVYVYDECVAYVGYDLTTGKAIPTASYAIPLYSEDRSDAVSISVTTPPVKTAYAYGEWFDGRGMVVEATRADGSTAPVKGWGVSDAGELAEEDTGVFITYGNCDPVRVSVTVGAKPSVHGEGVFEGSGTADDPFLISTPEDFAVLTDLMNACTDSGNPCGGGYFYRQTADIDMAGYEGYDGTHVLNDSRKVYFGGIYDGGGHTINVRIVSPGQTSVFPYITGALLNLKFTGSIDAGTATSTASAQPIRTMQAGSVIADCVFEMTLSASIANGVCYSSYGTMFNVYASGVAKKAVYTTNSGGSYYHVYTNMRNAAGTALTHSTTVASSDLDAIAAAFNDREDAAFTSGMAALAAVCPGIGAEALGEVTVENGELILSGGSFTVSEPVIPGSGTFEDPYLIGTPGAFKLLTDLMNACTSSSSPYGAGCFFRQTADIDMAGYEGYDGTHVLNDTRKVYFGGIYDGGGHTLSVRIVSEGQTAVFPYITGAILNLKIAGSIDSGTATSTASAQPIRAIQAGAVVANCVFEVTMRASKGHGVCYSLYGTLFNVFVTGVADSKAVYTTNTGKCCRVFTNVTKPGGSALTHSTTVASNDLDAIAAALNDREDSAYTTGTAALAAVDARLTGDLLMTLSKDGGALVFDAAPVLKGDLTRNGEIDINDVTALLDLLSIAQFAPTGDMNDDQTLDISDVTLLLDLLRGR